MKKIQNGDQIKKNNHIVKQKRLLYSVYYKNSSF